MIKNLVVGVLLIGVGGVAGYIVSRKILEDEYQKDIAEIKRLYQEKVDDLDSMIAEIKKNRGDVPDDEEPEEPEEPEETLEEKDAREALAVYRGQRRRSVIEYNKPSLDSFKEAMNEMYREGVSVTVDSDEDSSDFLDDSEEYEEVEDEEYEAELEERSNEYARLRTENTKNGRPYIIEPEEYREGPEGYDHQALYYYSQDRTLCEDDDTEVEEEEECVGFDYEDILDMQTTCWVRNDQLQVLYEIHRIDDSYKNAVASVSETPREREFRIQGRRKQGLDNKARK